jgi:hypothetical protein
MAIVFVASNIARAFSLARCLRAESPIVFAYDQDVPAMVDDIPALGVPLPHLLTEAARRALWYEIDTYARRSHPAMVIADTETADLCEGAGEVRILLVDGEFSKRHPLRYRKYARTCTEVIVIDDGEKRSVRGIAKSLQAIAQTNSLPELGSERRGRPRPISTRSTGNSVNRLVIRFDDVTELEDVVVAIILSCLEQGLCLSLDVIPYLCRFDASHLRSLGAGADRVEVAQHGYAHLRRIAPTGQKTEFTVARDAETLLLSGKAALGTRFPEHFHGGYSPPYDHLAPGLAETWQQLGGRYVSTLSRLSSRPPLPHVRLTTDPWDWVHQRPRPTDKVIASLDHAAMQDGVAGLVLHPAPLRSCGELERMQQIIGIMARRGFTPSLVSTVAGEAHQHS